MKKTNRLKIAFVLIFSLVSLSTAFGNSQLYSVIQRICSKYQMPVDYGMMSLINLADGKQELTLNLSSSRNGFDKSLLVGFYAAGMGIQKLNADIEKVSITVSVNYKDTEQFIASANKEDIIAYASGKMKYSDFMKKVIYL